MSPGLWLDGRGITEPALLPDPRPGVGPDRWLLNAWQVARWGRAEGAGPKLVEAAVTVPDFLSYARLLSTGQAGQVAAMPGSLPAVALAGLAASPAVMARPWKALQKDFWVVAEVLLRYDLALLPRWHRGPVLLHAQVADMAFALDQERFMGRAFGLLAGRGRKVGLHTQQLPTALSCLARWRCSPDLLGALWLPGDEAGWLAWESARESGLPGSLELLGEATSHPRDLAAALGRGEAPSSGPLPQSWLLPPAAFASILTVENPIP